MFTFCKFLRNNVLIVLLPLFILSGCGNTSSPSISSFSPSGGSVGTTVTIVGTNFSTTASNNTVSFNGTTAVVTSSTSTEIITTVPTGATTGPISVAVSGETGKSSSNFTVNPAITSFTPTNGSIGTSVTITGTGFDTTTTNNIVKFNGTTAVVTSSTSTSIITSVPSGATSGQITITVNGQSTITSSNFTVN